MRWDAVCGRMRESGFLRKELSYNNSMEHTKTLEELIEEVSDRNMKAEYDEDKEKAYYDKMERIYNAYVDDNKSITKSFKIKAYTVIGITVAIYTAYFVWRAMS
jgi:hypothetical protein